MSATALFGSTALAAPQASDQGETAAQGSERRPELEEVVVTAERRSALLQQTPISITALSGETLQAQGITDLKSIIQQTPGVAFKSYGPGQTEIQMRGMNSAGGQSPTVGFYLDDTPLTPPAGAQNGKVVIDPDLFDLKRVEILRGPQGTLYGAGSMGGTVRLITSQPEQNKLSSTVDVTGSTTEGGGFGHAENGVVNLPLVDDKLALRISGSYRHDAGWIDRIVVRPFPLPLATDDCGFSGCVRGDVRSAPVVRRHEDDNSADKYSVRVSMLYQPTEKLAIRPMILKQRTEADGYSLYDTDPGTNAHYQPVDIPEWLDDEITLYSLSMDYAFDWFTVTSSTAKWERDRDQLQDASEVVQATINRTDALGNVTVGLPGFLPQDGGIGGSTMEERDRSDQFSQELRLSSSWSGPFQMIFGGYYSRYHSVTGIWWNAQNTVDLVPTTVYTDYSQPTRVTQRAIFGEASYQVTGKLKLTAGLRHYSYDSEVKTTQSGHYNGGPIPSTSFATASASGYNPRFNVSFQASDDLLFYATAAKGFRPGAGNFAVADYCAPDLAELGRTAAPAQYDPDTVWSYEVGNKAQLFDQRLTINTAAYHQKWRGVQQLVALKCGFVFTDNAGTADVDGGEIEITARVTPELTLSAAGGYTRAAFTHDVPSTGAVEGRQLENVPKKTFSGAIDYSRPLNADMSLFTRLMGDYVGERRDVLGSLPSYNLLNWRIGLNRDAWSAAFFVNNLTDRRPYMQNASSLSINLPQYLRAATQTPRTMGLNFAYRFND